MGWPSLFSYWSFVVPFPVNIWVGWGKEGDSGGVPFKSWLLCSTWISNPKDGSTLRATRQCLTTGSPSGSLWYFNIGVYLDEHQDRPNYPKSCFIEKGVRIVPESLAETSLKKIMKKTKFIFVTPYPSTGLFSSDALCPDETPFKVQDSNVFLSEQLSQVCNFRNSFSLSRY